MPERPLASSAPPRRAHRVTAQHRHTHRNQCHKAGHSTTPLSASALSRQDSSRAPSLPRLSHTPETPYVDTRCSTRGPLHGSVNARKSDQTQTTRHTSSRLQRNLRTYSTARITDGSMPHTRRHDPPSIPPTTHYDPAESAESTRNLQAVPAVPCKTRPGHLHKTLQM